jgi:hypothetical protein
LIFIVVIDFTHSEARPAKAAVPESAGVTEDKAAFAGVGAQAAVDSERQRRDGLPAVPESPGVGAQASVEESAPSSTPGISEAKAAFAQSSGVA